MKSELFLLVVAVTLFFGTGARTSGQNERPNRQLTQGTSGQPQTSQRRIALVIGNGAYEHAGRLANPPNDATLVAATLRQLGFEVKNGSNLTQREMKQRIREFGQTLRANGGVGLFYYAGHGVQAKGHNYIVPVDADIQTEADLEDVAVDLEYVLNLMGDAQNALNIVILDACRNNPFARSFRSAQEGLAQVRAPSGTLIAYATAPDSIAADGSGANSPYTEELIKQMRASAVLVETMFRRVTEGVSARTDGKQEPWFSANVKGDFYFSGASNLDLIIEKRYWESIKDSNNPDDFKAYLDKYPNGQFVSLAKLGEEAAKSSAIAIKKIRDLYQQRRDDEALVEIRRLLIVQPTNAEAFLYTGRIKQRQGDQETAVAALKTAIFWNSRLIDAHILLGRIFLERNELGEARSYAISAMKIDPNNQEAIALHRQVFPKD